MPVLRFDDPSFFCTKPVALAIVPVHPDEKSVRASHAPTPSPAAGFAELSPRVWLQPAIRSTLLSPRARRVPQWQTRARFGSWREPLQHRGSPSIPLALQVRLATPVSSA